MAGAFHGVTEADEIINVGVSGPGVMRKALESAHGLDFGALLKKLKRLHLRLQGWVSLLHLRHQKDLIYRLE